MRSSLGIWFLTFHLRLYLALKLSMGAKPSHKLEFFATTGAGLETTLSREIKTLYGVKNVREGKCSVMFEGDIRSGLEAILWLRTPLKLMEKISTAYDIDSKDALYNWIASYDWRKLLDAKQTLKCDTTMGQQVCSDLDHTHFTSLTVKNAIVDQMRASSSEGLRPSVDIDDPDLPLSLYIHRAQGTLYRVWSGEKSMHKRGYRPEKIHKAALRETIAAALLLNTEWYSLCEEYLAYPMGSVSPPILCDPMCGSGTIPIEAALMVADTAPGLIKYGTCRLDSGMPNPLRWKDTAEAALPLWDSLWTAALKRDRRQRLKLSGRAPCIYGNDIHGGSVDLACQAAANAEVAHMTQFTVSDICQYQPKTPPNIYVLNPPWSQRLEGADEAAEKLRMYLSKRDSSAHSDTASIGATQQRKRPTPLWVLSGENRHKDNYLLDSASVYMKLSVAATEMSFQKYVV